MNAMRIHNITTRHPAYQELAAKIENQGTTAIMLADPRRRWRKYVIEEVLQKGYQEECYCNIVIDHIHIIWL